MAYEKQYSDAVRASVETVYGAGFLSPGGSAEVGHILDGLAIEGCDVLDLGCGPGGAAVALAGDLGAGRVLGIDVDARTLERAAETVAAAGLADRITLKLVEPGPLPVPDGSFDVVFSKDVIAHVTDKDTLYGEILRVLRPGGTFAGSDWMRGGDGPLSKAFNDWWEQLGSSGLRFEFVTAEASARGLGAAGFEEVEVRDHSDWTLREGRRNLDSILGPDRERLLDILGEEGFEGLAFRTRARIAALDSGDLLHCHLRARSPA